MTSTTKPSWYRVALGKPGGGAPVIVAAAGEHLGVSVAAAERHTPGGFAIAADLALDADIPLGESLGKSPVVELAPDAAGAAGAEVPADVPMFHWPVGVLPQLSRAAAVAGVRRGWTVRPHAE